MKKMVITIEIDGLNNWAVNWDSETESRNQIDLVKRHIKEAVCDELGVYSKSVEIIDCKIEDKK